MESGPQPPPARLHHPPFPGAAAGERFNLSKGPVRLPWTLLLPKPRAMQGTVGRVVRVKSELKVHPRRQESSSAAQETNSCGRIFIQPSKGNPNPTFFQWGGGCQVLREPNSARPGRDLSETTPVSLSNDPHRRGGRGPYLPETNEKRQKKKSYPRRATKDDEGPLRH